MRATSLLLIACGILAAQAASAQPEVPNKPVPVLDLERYAGTWHQIAHLPMRHQRKCERDTTATYTPQADGRILVRNACIDRDGELRVATGVAKTVPGAPGSLQVRFAPDWMSWLPFAWAPYWVIAVDPDYRWAMVGGPDREYLWILAREPVMAPERYAELVSQARAAGYPVDGLIREPTASTPPPDESGR